MTTAHKDLSALPEPFGYMSPGDIEHIRSRTEQYRGRNYNIKATVFLDRGHSAGSATEPVFTADQMRTALARPEPASMPDECKYFRTPGTACNKCGKVHGEPASTPVAVESIDFDTWQEHPYTKVLRKSIAEDYVPRSGNAGHADDIAIDKFAAAMKSKMAKKRREGRHGWQTCSVDRLQSMLAGHLHKGDPVDVANFCMMLHALKAPTMDTVHCKPWVEAAIAAINAAPQGQQSAASGDECGAALDLLANEGGMLVRTASLDSVQIAAARIEKRMFVREDGCGFAHIPRPAQEADEDLQEVAKALHYPECWDTAAYPTLKDAVTEVLLCFTCTNEIHLSVCPACNGAGGHEKELSSTTGGWVPCPECTPSENILPKVFEIWCEGYRISGNSDEARFLGVSTGKDFAEAVANFQRNNPAVLNEAEAQKMAIWGCKLFDNEVAARKSFG